MSGRGRRGVQGLLIVSAALVVMSYFAFARERPSGASRGAGLPLRQPSKAEIEASELASAQRCNLHNHPSESTTLKLSNCGAHLKNMDYLSKFKALRHLDLGNNDLKEFPAAVASLPLLEVLFLQGNQIRLVPPLHALKKLRILGLRGCRIPWLNGSVFPGSLEALILTDNAIERALNLSHLQKLRKLMLSHNELSLLDAAELPRSVELLRVANNRRLRLDFDELARMPSLAWVALSGTADVRGEKSIELKSVRWQDVQFDNVGFEESVLGAGASGSVAGGTWDGKDVVVKKFKAMSSDGLPQEEVSVLGKLAGEAGDEVVRPLGVIYRDGGDGNGARRSPEAVVLERLRGAQPLGVPPSLETVVRNRQPEFRVRDDLVRTTAVRVSRALRHVHAAGVAHGDLYAHNILWAPSLSGGDPTVKLSDFGAAWRVPPGGAAVMEAVEVLSFGHLLEDLVRWCFDCSTATHNALVAAVRQATRPDSKQRPTFAQLAEELSVLSRPPG
ncbi:Leucine-rich repeat protein soc-2-like protein [Diplonema papillatum]|nr:Leucine-rich repeat protein soc-2-like protein [Diplonema papillatum]